MGIAQISNRETNRERSTYETSKTRIDFALVLMALMTMFAAGCYYDRDDHWGYHRHPERRYSYRYDRDRDWRYGRYDRDYDRRYSRSNPSRDYYND